MISHSTEVRLRRLLAAQPSYKPTRAVLDRAQQTTVLCFVGASSMGKTTLMEVLARSTNDYGITKNFTSRAPRSEDTAERYTYFVHSDAGLRPIFDRIKSHELLQYNIHPYSLHVYGSEIEGYPHHYNMGDIFCSSIEGFRHLGFKQLYVFSVISEANVWLRRFNKRFPPSHPQRTARLQEAVSSLTWSLDQTALDHTWIINREDACSEAATDVQRIVNGETIDQTEARQLAQACLQTAQHLLLDLEETAV